MRIWVHLAGNRIRGTTSPGVRRGTTSEDTGESPMWGVGSPGKDLRSWGLKERVYQELDEGLKDLDFH